ncbi:dynamin family protein [Nostoc flagelliforme FACHB-838]|uniref:Dynamin family protein n=1 Tax=Nostoc flagelliforme FACHB-838 TaxID=2692904 RepID=A0ABR8E0U9_9NOSO|nr:dynamin family protein [Nostoc flagelliforme]MBD2534845.1 dynamin family protein [Nostoc flagelliforme FACHB-838]
MNTLLIGDRLVDLLSRIMGQKLTQMDTTPPVIFLANLITVLLGVIFADGIVTEEEKQRLLTMLYRFSTPKSDVRRLTHLMIKGIKESQLYSNFNEVLTLINPLTQSERLLVIGFGYEMAAVTGKVNCHEQEYLEVLAKYLDVKPQHLLVLAAAFKPEKHFDQAVLNEVYMLLDPELFQGQNTVFVKEPGVEEGRKQIAQRVVDKTEGDSNPSCLGATKQEFNRGLKSLLPLVTVRVQESEFSSAFSTTGCATCLLPSNFPEKVPLLPAQTRITEPRVSVSYEGLKKVQELSKQLDNYCQQIYQIVQACYESNFVPKDLIDEVSTFTKNLQLKQFRLAIVGEFSQGKSTLLNALLGEEIQPTREIPCTATVTILKYGMRKRIVCRYKDGSEEEIQFDEYQQKASISEDAAIGCLSDDLLNSEIEEIIFEHPDLELCSSGVEIIDSPGLNEHPELTVVTQKLLQDIDAAIFITNASRSLTQGERNLLHELRIKLNDGKNYKPANNLFIVGNFMDLVRTEKGYEQVKQRIFNFVQGDNPIITDKNRVHFISGQAALDAILNGYEDEYRKAFDSFTKSLESFLVFECGALKIERAVNKANRLIEKTINTLEKSDYILKSNIEINQTEKQKILEQIGEASGRDVKICMLAVELMDQALEKANISWNEWCEDLTERMVSRSDNWYFKHNPIGNNKKLILEYSQCFIKDLLDEINEWNTNQFNNIILRESLQILEANIKHELNLIQANCQQLGIRLDTSFSKEIELLSRDITSDFMKFSSISIRNALVVKLEQSIGIDFGFIAAFVAKVTAMIASNFGLDSVDNEEFYNSIKMKVLEIGLENFEESIDVVYKKLYENFDAIFDSKVESGNRLIEQAISLYEGLLQQQEKTEQEALIKYNISKNLIVQQCQELS